MDRRDFITQTAGIGGLTLLAHHANAVEEKNSAQLASTIRVKLSSIYIDDKRGIA